MNLRNPFLLLVSAVMAVLAAGSVLACVPGIEFVTEDSWQSYTPVSVCLIPGNPEAAKAYTYPGNRVTEEFRFPVIGVDGEPAAGETTSAYVYGADSVTFCEGLFDVLMADSDGWLTIPFSGGGSFGPDQDYGVRFFVNLCPNQELDKSNEIYFNSPDLNGDLHVNLSDVAAFAADFATGDAYRSDFNWDGTINIVDVGILAGAVGACCP